jgi:hypothetical protein
MEETKDIHSCEDIFDCLHTKEEEKVMETNSNKRKRSSSIIDLTQDSPKKIKFVKQETTFFSPTQVIIKSEYLNTNLHIQSWAKEITF